MLVFDTLDNSTSKYGKYKYLKGEEDLELLQVLQTQYQTELEEFGYDIPYVPKLPPPRRKGAPISGFNKDKTKQNKSSTT